MDSMGSAEHRSPTSPWVNPARLRTAKTSQPMCRRNATCSGALFPVDLRIGPLVGSEGRSPPFPFRYPRSRIFATMDHRAAPAQPRHVGRPPIDRFPPRRHGIKLHGELFVITRLLSTGQVRHGAGPLDKSVTNTLAPVRVKIPARHTRKFLPSQRMASWLSAGTGDRQSGLEVAAGLPGSKSE